MASWGGRARTCYNHWPKTDNAGLLSESSTYLGFLTDLVFGLLAREVKELVFFAQISMKAFVDCRRTEKEPLEEASSHVDLNLERFSETQFL